MASPLRLLTLKKLASASGVSPSHIGRKLLYTAILIMLAAVIFSASGCFVKSTTPTTPEVLKPKPIVEAVNAATSGMLDSYYAILDITVKNDGADGTVNVIASVTQGTQTIKNEMPVYITRNAKQVVRLVFPLKWKGGDWTPDVQVQVP